MKKGSETMAMIITAIAIILIITASTLVFMRSGATGKAIEYEAKAKQIAMLIDSAKPGTAIFVDSEIAIEENEVVVIANNVKEARYSFFNKADISFRKTEGGTEITLAG